MPQRLSERPDARVASAPAAEVALRKRGTPWRLLTSSWLAVVGDAAVLFAAFTSAYALRYVWRVGPELNEFQFTPLEAYWIVATLFVPITVLSFYVLGRYQTRRSVAILDDVFRILAGVLIGTAAVVVVFFVSRPLFFSRLMFLYLGAAGVVGALAWLWLRLGVIQVVRRAGYDNQRILIVGSGVVAKYLMQQLTASPASGNRVVGYLETDQDDARMGFGRFQRLGDVGDLEILIKTESIDEVYMALSAASQHNLEPLIERCRVHGVRFRVVPDLLETQFGRMEIHPLAGIPLVTLSDNEISGFRYVQKRTLDILASLLGLILSAPLWIPVAIAIRLDSPGRVLFRQTRIGKDGTEFTLLKFRSMVHDAEELKVDLIADGPHPALFKIRDDHRRTRVGRFLRRLSLDELPQLVNVLNGSMSLVGPRAQVSEEVAQYDEWARHRLRVHPGLTGLWQVSGRSDLLFEEMVMLDTYYVANWSLGLDLKILVKTIPAVLSGRGAF